MTARTEATCFGGLKEQTHASSVDGGSGFWEELELEARIVNSYTINKGVGEVDGTRN